MKMDKSTFYTTDTEYTDETWDNDVEFETQFIYNELKTWLKYFKKKELLKKIIQIC